MNRKTLYHITISGAPASWSLRSRMARVLAIAERARFIRADLSHFISASVVNTKEMIALNARYRGKRQDTDVLSFEQKGKAPKGMRFLGDLVLSKSRVREQARENRHRVGDELDVLIVHGLLHLLGYDHERSRAEFARMARAERRLLAALRGSNSLGGLISRKTKEKMKT